MSETYPVTSDVLQDVSAGLHLIALDRHHADLPAHPPHSGAPRPMLQPTMSCWAVHWRHKSLGLR